MSNGDAAGTALPEGVANLAKPSEETLNTAGGLLRRYRTDRGVDLYQLAAVLKVRPAKLDALENDRYEQLPDMVFTRALAASICRILQVDAAPVLALFPQADSPRLSRASDGLNQSFRGNDSSSGTVTIKEGRAGLRVFLLIAAILLATAAIYFWPQFSAWLPLSRVAEPVQPVSTAPQGGSAGGAGAVNFISQPLAVQGVPEPVEPAPLGAGTFAGAPAQEDAAAAPNGTPATGAEAAAEPAAAPDTLHISARNSVWIQVRDGSNALLRQTTLAKGQELAFQQEPPLKVEIGRIDAVDVRVKGQPFDLKPFARGNVARFEIAP